MQMVNTMLKEKLKASIVHLIISAIVVGLTLGLIIYFWYPLNYISVTRFIQIATVLICVDLVMGPVLTLVAYNSKKASLKFDLAIIATLQVAALGYGGYTLYQNHPLYVTFNIDRYTIVTAQDAEPEKAQYDEYKVSKLSSPKLAFAALPETLEAKNKLMLGYLTGEKDLDQRIDLYKPYSQNLDSINAKSMKVNKILLNAMHDKEVRSFQDKHAEKVKDYTFLPLTGPTDHAILVINGKDGEVVSTIKTDPWQYKQKIKVTRR